MWQVGLWLCQAYQKQKSLILVKRIIFRGTALSNDHFKTKVGAAHSNTGHIKPVLTYALRYLQKFSSDLLLPLGKFFFFFVLFTWGWMTNKISLLLVVWAMDAVREWASRRGWSFLSIEGEKTHAALHSLAEWAHFSNPYSSHWWEQHFSPPSPSSSRMH